MVSPGALMMRILPGALPVFLKAWTAPSGILTNPPLPTDRGVPSMYRTALVAVAETLGPEKLDRLVNMLAATSGIESYLALKEVCRLDDAEADATAVAITDAVVDRFLPADR